MKAVRVIVGFCAVAAGSVFAMEVHLDLFIDAKCACANEPRDGEVIGVAGRHVVPVVQLIAIEIRVVDRFHAAGVVVVAGAICNIAIEVDVF